MNLDKKSSPPGKSASNSTRAANNDENIGISPSSSAADLDKLRLNDSNSGGGGLFTQEEINVLKNGSNINGRSYVPFFLHMDAKERFSFSIPYTYVQFTSILFNFFL